MEISNSLDNARELIKNGKRKQARSLLRELNKSHPGNEYVYILFADASDNREDAKTCLRQALKINPKNKIAFLKYQELVGNPPEAQKSPSKESNSEIDVHPGSEHSNRIFNKKELIFLMIVIAGIAIFTIGILVKSISRRNENRDKVNAEATQTQCLYEFQSSMADILSRFFRQYAIAETTSRINLPAQIARLEDIRNEAWNMPQKGCAQISHAHLMDYMDKTIESLISFSADDTDLIVTYKLLDALEALINLDDDVIRTGIKGGLLELFRNGGYYYWEILEDPDWKESKPL